ncbi:hypothetical protein EVAR_79524_1 [Eumeta japonica]|uniref:Uncharacterized protein n=1 Tax=Eumeta variegata TaxID=151549 RepID=A0A4C1UDR1_EUMVA|nr:hypothetical protein EVAR_79524_1 [Eumeta japonica]
MVTSCLKLPNIPKYSSLYGLVSILFDSSVTNRSEAMQYPANDGDDSSSTHCAAKGMWTKLYQQRQTSRIEHVCLRCQSRYEERDNDGRVHGHYGYMDKRGKLRVVKFEADPERGFHSDAVPDPDDSNPDAQP